MPLDQSIIDSVANSNFKTMSEQVQITANLMAQNSASHQNRLQMIAEASVGQILKNANEFDTEQAQSVRTVINTELAPLLAGLAASIASNQQYVKAAHTTPPPTA